MTVARRIRSGTDDDLEPTASLKEVLGELEMRVCITTWAAPLSLRRFKTAADMLRSGSYSSKYYSSFNCHLIKPSFKRASNSVHYDVGQR